VTQKDLLFTFDGQAFGGMLNGRRALLVYARGLDYGPGGLPPDVYDFQKPYLETWLRFVGISDIETIIVQKTLFGPEVDSASRTEAKKEAGEVGSRFAGLVSA
jgi:FMN-dependent NADH-azoreductase